MFSITYYFSCLVQTEYLWKKRSFLQQSTNGLHPNSQNKLVISTFSFSLLLNKLGIVMQKLYKINVEE